MKALISIFFFLILINYGCQDNSNSSVTDNKILSEKIQPAKWNIIDSINIKNINSDLKPGQLTMDVGVYFPSNFDTAFKKVTLPLLMTSIKNAKEIYAPTGVQINLLFVKTGIVDPKYFTLQANEIPDVPQTEYANMYQHMFRHPAILTKTAEVALKSIVEPHPDNHRTIYLIVLQDVFFPFLTVSEGRNWIIKSVRTGGLSFPTYSYVNEIPAALRGVITISNLQRPDRLRRTVAHEIGHKTINVSHEYGEINPENEVFAEGGLMVYGNGEEISSGEKGRWHKERLQLSPFLYRLNEDGKKIWNPEYKEAGHYYDPLYKNYVIHFNGLAQIAEDW